MRWAWPPSTSATPPKTWWRGWARSRPSDSTASHRPLRSNANLHQPAARRIAQGSLDGGIDAHAGNRKRQVDEGVVADFLGHLPAKVLCLVRMRCHGHGKA